MINTLSGTGSEIQYMILPFNYRLLLLLEFIEKDFIV